MKGGDKMLVLKTECDLTPEQIEAMRKKIRERTGEDCIIDMYANPEPQRPVA